MITTIMRSLFTKKYPEEINQEIKKLRQSRDDSLTPFSKKIIVLAAVLRNMGFIVVFAHDGEQEGFGEGPRLDLESPEGRKLRQTKWPPLHSAEREARKDEISRHNLVYQTKLMLLLEEFYETRNPNFRSRLIIHSVGLCGSEIAPQAIEVMTMPEYKPERKKWLKESLSEMQAFAEFLISKLS